ncbi:MAG: hypothetical protein R2698_00240 [Microthrixaceae bacterium]
MSDQRPEPLLPDYSGACTVGITPALLGDPDEAPDWMPEAAVGAEQTIVMVLDGLGWNQLQQHLSLMPTVAAMHGRASPRSRPRPRRPHSPRSPPACRPVSTG